MYPWDFTLYSYTYMYIVTGITFFYCLSAILASIITIMKIQTKYQKGDKNKKRKKNNKTIQSKSLEEKRQCTTNFQPER